MSDKQVQDLMTAIILVGITVRNTLTDKNDRTMTGFDSTSRWELARRIAADIQSMDYRVSQLGWGKK